MNYNGNDIENLITRHLTGESTGGEEDVLRSWLAANPDNEAVFQKFKRAFDLAKGKERAAPVLEEIDVEQEWFRFRNEITKGQPKSVSFSGRWNALYKAAAGFALLLAATFIVNYFLEKESLTEIQTANETKVANLPDGSTVTLNKNSKITYDSKFNNRERRVNLEGEAYFQVAGIMGLPFVITAGPTEIVVVGTEFNVTAYGTNDRVEVTVTEGRVKFTGTKKSTAIELAAGDKGVYSITDSKLNLQTNEDPNYNAWLTRKIIFEDEPLATVFKVLNNVYNKQIVANENVIANCRVTASFDNQSLEAVLNVLKTTLNLTYTIAGNKVEIVSAECQ